MNNHVTLIRVEAHLTCHQHLVMSDAAMYLKLHCGTREERCVMIKKQDRSLISSINVTRVSHCTRSCTAAGDLHDCGATWMFNEVKMLRGGIHDLIRRAGATRSIAANIAGFIVDEGFTLRELAGDAAAPALFMFAWFYAPKTCVCMLELQRTRAQVQWLKPKNREVNRSLNLGVILARAPKRQT